MPTDLYMGYVFSRLWGFWERPSSSLEGIPDDVIIRVLSFSRNRDVSTVLAAGDRRVTHLARRERMRRFVDTERMRRWCLLALERFERREFLEAVRETPGFRMCTFGRLLLDEEEHEWT